MEAVKHTKMSSIDFAKYETKLTSEFVEYQKLHRKFTEVRSGKFKPVVLYFEMHTAAENINKKVANILAIHSKLPELLQLKHNQLIEQITEESALINYLVDAEKTKSFTVDVRPQVEQLPSTPKIKKRLRHVTPKKSGNRWQLASVRKPASPLNTPKRLSKKFSLSNFKCSGSGFIKFKLAQEVLKYHQLYENFIALEKSKFKRVVQCYEMRKVAENLNKKFEQILNIRKQLPEIEPSNEDSSIQQVVDNHARINSILNIEEENSSEQNAFTPKRKNKKFDNIFKRRDSTPRKNAKEPKTMTPKKAKTAMALGRQLNYEFSTNNSKEGDANNESKLHKWVSSAVLKLNRRKTNV